MKAATAFRPLRRRWRWLLALSLLMNLFFVGALVGHQVRGPRALESRFLGELPMVVRALPQEDRPLARQIFRTHADEVRRAFDAMHTAREDALDALTQTPFDPDALDIALEGLRETASSAQAAVHGVMLEITVELDDEARLALAERIAAFRDRAPRHPRFGGDRDPGDRGPGDRGPGDRGPGDRGSDSRGSENRGADDRGSGR